MNYGFKKGVFLRLECTFWGQKHHFKDHGAVPAESGESEEAAVTLGGQASVITVIGGLSMARLPGNYQNNPSRNRSQLEPNHNRSYPMSRGFCYAHMVKFS